MAESPILGILSCMTHQTMAERLCALDLHPATKILSEIFSGKAEFFHVGGSVRDALLGRPIHDLDFSCSLAPQEIVQLLSVHDVRSLEMSAKHGTIIAVIDGKNHEITQFRDMARTCVGDLKLRDFTINAMAYPVSKEIGHQLVDPLNGCDDLVARIVRGCEDPEQRIQEDPLRILRAIRFGPAQEFAIEPRTASAMTSQRALLKHVSPERIRDELEKILMSSHPRAAFHAMRDLRLLEIILPEILPSIGSEQNEWHVEDVFEHTLSVIERAERERIQRWCALFHDLGKPATVSDDEDGRRHFYGHEKVSETIAQEVTKRLRFSIDDQRLIALLVRQHMRPVNVGESGVRRILRDLGEAFQAWRLFKWADASPALSDEVVKAELAAFDDKVNIERLRPKGSVYGALAVDGNDLLALGFSAGPELGSTLKALHEAVLDDPNSNEREILLALAKKRLNNNNHGQ